MNWHALIDPALSGRLCLMLLHSVWQVALLALVARVLERLWRNRSVERCYATYVAALMAALVAMPVTFALMEVAGPPGGDSKTDAAIASADPTTSATSSANTAALATLAS